MTTRAALVVLPVVKRAVVTSQKRRIPVLERWLCDESFLIDLNTKARISRDRVAERGVALDRRFSHEQLGKDGRIPLRVHGLLAEIVLQVSEIGHGSAEMDARGS